MEDEDGKIRRNLVAVSCVIILLAWLDLPMGTVTERLLGVAGKEGVVVDPQRVWLAATALLAYLGIRFDLSAEAAQARASYAEMELAIQTNAIRSLVREEGRRHEVAKPRTSIFGDELEDLIQARIQSIENYYPADRPVERPKVETSFSSSRSAHAVLRFKLRSGITPKTELPPTLDFNLSHWTRARFWFFTNIRVAAYSSAGMGVVWPSVFACIAATICLWKVFAQYF